MKTLPIKFSGRMKRTWTAVRTWMTPGIGLKRWLVVLIFGTLSIGLGIAVFALDLYRSHPDSDFIATIALNFIPRPVRILVLLSAGGGLIGFSLWELSHSLLAPFAHAYRPVSQVVAEYRRLERGPQVVAIGGGHGQSTLLRGLKERTNNLTAIVTVADDGGSSGKLRRSLGIPPPGDLRNCLAALSDDESLLTQLFQYRFAEGEVINGHAFGNLFISALAGVTGSFEQGLIEASRVLSVRGKVVPSSLCDVRLEGELVAEKTNSLLRVSGESQIPEVSGAIWRVWLEPEHVPAYPEAMQAILSAELIVVGPGSLFTSILPNLLIPGIRDALRSSRALKVYVCNMATQPGETDGFSIQDHVQAIERHIGWNPFDVVLAATAEPQPLPDGVTWVGAPLPEGGVRTIRQDLSDPVKPGYHHSQKLAAALMDLLEKRAEFTKA
jgi:uncharacterized cofD-like protein